MEGSEGEHHDQQQNESQPLADQTISDDQKVNAASDNILSEKGDGDANEKEALKSSDLPESAAPPKSTTPPKSAAKESTTGHKTADTPATIGVKDVQNVEADSLSQQNLSPEDTPANNKVESENKEKAADAVLIAKKPKKPRKAIFVSYSPDAGFIERKFVVETVRQLKENNLSEDLWFDRDEKIIDSPLWFSARMEAVEKCKAAILILSDSYFSCPVSAYESRALLERQRNDPKSVRIFLVKFSEFYEACLPRVFTHLVNGMVDLSVEPHLRHSLAERTSVVIGAIMEDLERYATVLAPPSPLVSPDKEYTGEYKRRKICQWTCSDLQEWLFSLGIKEFYRQTVAEQMVDGFLLMSLTDQDMVDHLGIDSRAVRKKLMQQILTTLDKEHKLAENWHLRARAHRSRPSTVYVVYDPQDVRLAQGLKNELIKKGVQVRSVVTLRGN